jgi:hypothetical protein
MTKSAIVINSSIPELQAKFVVPLVRIGRDNDGGYVTPSMILKTPNIFFQVAMEMNFRLKRISSKIL